jgi:hypothetical protein
MGIIAKRRGGLLEKGGDISHPDAIYLYLPHVIIFYDFLVHTFSH